MLTPKKLAERLSLSLSMVYRLLTSGELECHRFGAAYRVSEEQLAEYLESTKHKTKDAVKRPAHRQVRRVNLRHL